VLDHVAFLRACEEYRRGMVQFLNRDTAINDLPKNRTDLGIPGVKEKYYQPGRELWEKVPPFHHEVVDTSAVVRRHAPALAALAAWCVAALLLARRTAAS
jgi:hypothetical protein